MSLSAMIASLIAGWRRVLVMKLRGGLDPPGIYRKKRA
jgi:hypothetical protein